MAHGWIEEYWHIFGLPQDDRYRVLSHVETKDTDTNVLSLACATKDRQCEPMNGTSGYKPTSHALVSLRQEQGRQNSQDKAETTRRRIASEIRHGATFFPLHHLHKIDGNMNTNIKTLFGNGHQNTQQRDHQWQDHQSQDHIGQKIQPATRNSLRGVPSKEGTISSKYIPYIPPHPHLSCLQHVNLCTYVPLSSVVMRT